MGCAGWGEDPLAGLDLLRQRRGMSACTMFSATVCNVWLLFFLGGVPRPEEAVLENKRSADEALFFSALFVGSVLLRWSHETDLLKNLSRLVCANVEYEGGG
nr:hypothetical protein BaRGS_015925 [Batillaria attramentaria]